MHGILYGNVHAFARRSLTFSTVVVQRRVDPSSVVEFVMQVCLRLNPHDDSDDEGPFPILVVEFVMQVCLRLNPLDDSDKRDPFPTLVVGSVQQVCLGSDLHDDSDDEPRSPS